jgi:hypothetical protein
LSTNLASYPAERKRNIAAAKNQHFFTLHQPLSTLAAVAAATAIDDDDTKRLL